MYNSKLATFLSLAGAFVSAAFEDDLDPLCSNSDTIVRDVLIIGGGSSGTYAGIRLLQKGVSVAVVEKEPVLGGYVNTFHDPVTGKTFDYGVISFDNITIVQDYFGSFNISLVSPSGDFGVGSAMFANFETDGKIQPVPATIPWGNQTEVGLALFGFAEQFARFPFLVNGFNDLPDPIPEDLLIPFGDFLDKYQLGALAYTAFTFNQGMGNILAAKTIYVMKYLAEITVQNVLGAGPGFLTTKDHNNHELYDAALARFGDSAIMSATVTRVVRGKHGVEATVQTPSGTKTVKAKKLLIAIQPKMQALQGIGLDLAIDEQEVFQQFNNSFYWDMVIRDSGIPDDVSVDNVNFGAALGLPALPGLHSLGRTALPGLHTAYYTSPFARTDDEVKADTLATLAKVVAANGFDTSARPEFVGFNNHSPFVLTVSVDAIRGGFYRRLNALQGRRNTWWTGAAWQAQDSTQIWNWTETNVLPQLVASLTSQLHN